MGQTPSQALVFINHLTIYSKHKVDMGISPHSTDKETEVQSS